MSCIYIHIPFCKQACYYCDFHFSTSLKNKDAFLDALKKEIRLQKNYLTELSLPDKTKTTNQIDSVYFGGGTPSLLSQKDFFEIFDELNKYFSIVLDAEITVEANPDDLTKQKLVELKHLPVNRLSIGIQSFTDEHLRLLNRTHTAETAHKIISEAQNAGFKNLTIDLIYGIPGLSDEQWIKNLETAFFLNIPHLSCYCLTVEPKTVLAYMIKTKKISNVDDEQGAKQFEITMNMTDRAGYEQYEISNFAKKNYYSRHNSTYWTGKKYLGLGPSAHSFNKTERQWNVANNNQYIRVVNQGIVPCEKEILSPEQKCNEYLLTSLRTAWGCDLKKIKMLGEKKNSVFMQKCKRFIEDEKIIHKGDKMILSRTGKTVADRIIAELFW